MFDVDVPADTRPAPILAPMRKSLRDHVLTQTAGPFP